MGSNISRGGTWRVVQLFRGGGGGEGGGGVMESLTIKLFCF